MENPDMAETGLFDLDEDILPDRAITASQQILAAHIVPASDSQSPSHHDDSQCFFSSDVDASLGLFPASSAGIVIRSLTDGESDSDESLPPEQSLADISAAEERNLVVSVNPADADGEPRELGFSESDCERRRSLVAEEALGFCTNMVKRFGVVKMKLSIFDEGFGSPKGGSLPEKFGISNAADWSPVTAGEVHLGDCSGPRQNSKSPEARNLGFSTLIRDTSDKAGSQSCVVAGEFANEKIEVSKGKSPVQKELGLSKNDSLCDKFEINDDPILGLLKDNAGKASSSKEKSPTRLNSNDNVEVNDQLGTKRNTSPISKDIHKSENSVQKIDFLKGKSPLRTDLGLSKNDLLCSKFETRYGQIDGVRKNKDKSPTRLNFQLPNIKGDSSGKVEVNDQMGMQRNIAPISNDTHKSAGEENIVTCSNLRVLKRKAKPFRFSQIRTRRVRIDSESDEEPTSRNIDDQDLGVYGRTRDPSLEEKSPVQEDLDLSKPENEGLSHEFANENRKRLQNLPTSMQVHLTEEGSGGGESTANGAPLETVVMCSDNETKSRPSCILSFVDVLNLFSHKSDRSIGEEDILDVARKAGYSFFLQSLCQRPDTCR